MERHVLHRPHLHPHAASARSGGPVAPTAAPMLLALEPRWMFDGAAAGDAAHAVDKAAGDAPAAKNGAVPGGAVPGGAVTVRAADPGKLHGRREVVVVDTALDDYKTLEAGIRAGVGIVEIDGSRDGLAQLAAWARTQGDLDAIHILSYGGAGGLRLGTGVLDGEALANRDTRDRLATVGAALNTSGDLLLYGCDVARGADGRAFVSALAEATNADIAASDDLTGAARQGGDWHLERASGTVSASSLRLSGWGDSMDAVSLRHGRTVTAFATIQDAIDAATDGDTVTVGAGTYTEQLTITEHITLKGAGEGKTILRSPLALNLEQSGGTWTNLKNQDVFSLIAVRAAGSGTVNISDLTVDGRNQGDLRDLDPAYLGDPNLYDFTGILVQNTDAVIDSVTVTRVRDLYSDFGDTLPADWPQQDQPGGLSRNHAIMVEGWAGTGQHRVEIADSTITKYQKTGIIAWGPTLTVDIHGNVIRQQAGTYFISANGIQIGSSDRSGMGGTNGDRTGTTGRIADNQILDIGRWRRETDPSIGGWVGGGTGILVYQGGAGLEITGNTITGLGKFSWTDDHYYYPGRGDFGWYSNIGIWLMGADGTEKYIVKNNTLKGLDSGIESYSAGNAIMSGNVMSGNRVDYWQGESDDTITLADGSQTISYFSNVGPYAGAPGGNSLYRNFGVGDKIIVAGSTFGGGRVTVGNGSSITAHGIEIQHVDGRTIVRIDTDGVAGTHEQILRLDGIYQTGNFALSERAISYVALNPTVDSRTVSEGVLSGPITLTRPDGNGWEMRQYRITGLTGGRLFADAAGRQEIRNGDLITIRGDLTQVYFLADGASGVVAGFTAQLVNASGGRIGEAVTTALPVRYAPDAGAGGLNPPRALLGQGYGFPLPAGTFTDPDGDGTALTYAASGLPQGLSIDPATGAIGGTPTRAGTYTVTLTATDGDGLSVSRAVTLIVDAPPVAGAFSPPPAVRGEAYAVPLPTGTFRDGDSPGRLTYSASGLPDGLRIDPATGTISGTPETAGPRTVVITATDSAGNSVALTVRLTVNDRPVAAADSLTAPRGAVGSLYTYTLPSGTFTDADAAPGERLTYGADGLPRGLRIDPATGAITGTPRAFGTFAVVVTATDGDGLSRSVTVALTIEDRTGAAPVTRGPAPSGAAGAQTGPAEGDGEAGLQTILRGDGDAGGQGGGTGQGLPLGDDAGGNEGTGATGFRVAVVGAGSGVGDAAVLLTQRPVTEVIPAQDGGIRFTLPADTFVATTADTVVQLRALQIDGSALPGWLAFNPQTGTFVGTPPPGEGGDLVVRVIARDQKTGAEAVATVRIRLGAGQQEGALPDAPGNGVEASAQAPRPSAEPGRTIAAKAGFSQQLKIAGRVAPVRAMTMADGLRLSGRGV